MIPPSASILPFGGHAPIIAPDAFVAPGARLIGQITLGAQASIWYNCVLRGDVNRIVIGARSNIQDMTVIHVDSAKDGGPGFPTLIGADVLIGHSALVHGAILEDQAFVGLGSVVMDGCRIESGGMLGAGALLAPGKVIRARELWLGRPARFVRMLSEAEVAAHREGVAHYVEAARAHRAAVKDAGSA